MKTIHIVVEDGFIVDAFADFEVDVIVYDLDCPDPEQKVHVENEVTKLRKTFNKVEVY